MARLVARAAAAFVALPGVVAVAIPGLLLAAQPSLPPMMAWALVPLTLGVAPLVSCVVAFYRQGHGTLAPWDPPQRLVIGGLYRWSRNPMYVAVITMLWSWAAAFPSSPLVVYAGAATMAMYVRVVHGEEPALARRYPEEWAAYQVRVPRWIGVPRRVADRALPEV